ncbi:RAB6A-GEF complex partner protein 2 [Histomonas meleagridis]|uniref:RAB6A-GEF complex partner protein 2 n=1 Tax=Histomonas meleagridis TaxID=135588 RepID=UPI00355AB91E|nr:RAB6A-GEF complex partner protein 2 [Histomonas meleagridis]KAH0803717.1 RAB6A-GEF complex partner protein 2 [Histomonas meleagridis]
MKITITPNNPMIFLGQKFTVQVDISDCESKVLWVSAQIAGKVRSLKPATESILQNLVHDSLGIQQETPFFGHVMSGSRLISRNFYPPKSFCATLIANGIPPSYDGEGISIKYELRFAAQIENQPVTAISIPIRLIAPFSSSLILEKAQSTGSFEITSFETGSVPAPFSLGCPFKDTSTHKLQTYQIQSKGSTIVLITMDSSFNAGNEVTGVIDIKVPLKEVHIKVIRNELYEANGHKETTILSTTNIGLENTLMKRFNIPITFQTVPNFSTDIFVVSYLVQFIFNQGTEQLQWETPIYVHPPVISLSTQRTPLNLI